MLLTINGQGQRVPEFPTVAALLDHLGVQGTVAVELNGTVVRRQDRRDAGLLEGDRLEIVHFVGGG